MASLEKDGKESKKFLAAHPEYVQSFQNMLVLLDWLATSNRTPLNAVKNESAYSFVARNALWTYENLEKAFTALTAVNALELYAPAGPLERARKEIAEVKVTTILPKDIEEALVACKAEMYLHYYMTAQELLGQAKKAGSLYEAITLAAEGLVALDKAEECGATRPQVRALEKKLKDVCLKRVEKE